MEDFIDGTQFETKFFKMSREIEKASDMLVQPNSKAYGFSGIVSDTFFNCADPDRDDYEEAITEIRKFYLEFEKDYLLLSLHNIFGKIFSPVLIISILSTSESSAKGRSSGSLVQGGLFRSEVFQAFLQKV